MSRWAQRLAPWGDLLPSFKANGFYERYPAKGEIERFPGWLAVYRADKTEADAEAIAEGIVAFFTPIADPARLAVADQVRRLESGRVAPAQFDFTSLRFDGARYYRVDECPGQKPRVVCDSPTKLPSETCK